MNKFMKKLMSKKEGFTLVELIVVIAILAILAGVAIPAYSGYIKKANNTADTTTLSAIKTAALAACATEGTVTKIDVAEATDSKNTVEITCGTDVYKMKYDGSKWADNGTANTVAAKATVIADFNTYMENDNFDLKNNTAASWNGSDWTLTPAS